MKKQFLLISGFAIFLTLVLFSCQKKNDSSAITPGYGATGNPNPNNQTVTGATTYTSPATQNSSLLVGNSGWSNPTCSSSSSLILKGVNGDISVTLAFSSAATSGTYAVSQTPSTGACVLTVINAPNQPAGLVWVGKSGNVVVTTNSTSINAQLNGITCVQQSFQFPMVTVSGVIACSQ